MLEGGLRPLLLFCCGFNDQEFLVNPVSNPIFDIPLLITVLAAVPATIDSAEPLTSNSPGAGAVLKLIVLRNSSK